MNSPYKGLVPYAEEDREYFFGRNVECKIIAANLRAARLTLFYGASGVGKSSVLNAGVVPQLDKMARENIVDRGAPGFVVVVFRSWRDNPLVALNARIRGTVSSAINQELDAPASSALSLASTMEDCIERLDGRIIVILDQFEEYFLYQGQESGKGTFADEFPAAINRQDLRINFLISIREDALAKLDRFKGRIPNLFDNYLRIEHLDYKSASDAITEPIAKYLKLKGDHGQPRQIEDGLVPALLEEVTTGKVVIGEKGRGVVEMNKADQRIEAPFLQLVMERLWAKEVENKSLILRKKTLTDLGGAEKIVSTHLDDLMKDLPESQQAAAAEIFDRLVTPTGAKIAQTIPDLVKYATADNKTLQEKDIEDLLESLSRHSARILRAVPGPLDQPQLSRYEIFHDVLGAAILSWRELYLKKRHEEESIRRSEQEIKEKHERELAESERSHLKLYRRGAIVLAVLLILVGAFGVIAYKAKMAAESAVDAERVAVRQARFEAEQARFEERKARIVAEVTQDGLSPEEIAKQNALIESRLLAPATQDNSIPSHGFIYYGERSGDRWKFQFLKRASSPDDAIPKEGDWVIALRDAYVRASIGKSTATQKIGSVGKDKMVKVVGVKVQAGHVYIEFGKKP